MGFHLGMAAEINLSGKLALGSGLIFAEKGFKEDYQLSEKDKTTFFYLEVPLLWILKCNFFRQGFYFLGVRILITGYLPTLLDLAFQSIRILDHCPSNIGILTWGLNRWRGLPWVSSV